MKIEQDVLDQMQIILDQQSLGVLATQGDEFPYSTLIAFSPIRDKHEIIFATIKETRKYNHIIKTPPVSLLIDTRQNQIKDFKDAAALTVLGHAYEIEKSESFFYTELYLSKHPYLKEFVKTTNCALIKIEIKHYILVNRFQNVFEYHVT